MRGAHFAALETNKNVSAPVAADLVRSRDLGTAL